MVKDVKVQEPDRVMDRIDEALYKAIVEKEDTVYGLVKRTGHAWPTVRIHLHYLEQMGLAKVIPCQSQTVGGFKDVWRKNK